MTQFSNSPLLSGSRPQGGFLSGQQLQNAIQTDSLQVFNVPAVGAINQGNNIAELRQVFGLVGQTVGAAGQVVGEQRRNAENVDAGIAAQRRSLDLLTFQQGVADGSIRVPAGANVAEFASAYVDEYANTAYSGASEAFKREYSRMAPQFGDVLLRKKLADDAQAKKEALGGFQTLAYDATDAAGIEKALAGAESLGLNRTEALATTVLPALRAAAENGDADRFSRLKATLPSGQFLADVQNAEIILDAKKRQAQNLNYTKGEDFLQSLEDQGMPSDLIRSAVNDLHDNGQIAPGVKTKWDNHLDQIDATRQYEADVTLAESIVNSARVQSPYTDDLDKLKLRNPAVYDKILPTLKRVEEQVAVDGYVRGLQAQVQAGMPLALVQDQEIELPSGQKIKVQGKEAQTLVMNAELNRIMSTGDPLTRLPRAIEWSRDNDVYPPEFKTNLEIGVSQAGSLATGGQPTPMTLNAINTWREIQKRDPNWGRRLVDANTHRFLDAAVRNLAITQDDPARAIRLAVDAASVPADVQAYRRKQVWDKMVERENRNTLGLDMTSRNSRQVLERLRAIAESKADFGMNPDQALSEAAQEIAATTKKINGAYINMNVRGMTDNLRKNFEPLSLNIIKEYVGQSGQNTDDFTFEPDPIREGLWMVRKHGIPAEDPNGQFTFTTDALIARLQVEQKAASEAGKDKIQSAIKSRETRNADAALLQYERSVINPY